MPSNATQYRRDILESIRDEVMYRLEGDLPLATAAQVPRVWTADKVMAHVRGGYDSLLTSCGLLWDVLPAEDWEALSSYSFPWEDRFGSSGVRWNIERRIQDDGSGPRFYYERLGLQTGRSTFDFLYERKYTEVGNPAGYGPAAISFPWERDGGIGPANARISGFITATLAVFSPLWEIPRWVVQIVRAVWNRARIDAARSTDLERLDTQYEQTRGHVSAYVTDKDGHGILRKFRIPSISGSRYITQGTAGLLRGAIDVDQDIPDNVMHLDEWAIISPTTSQLDYAGGVGLYRDFNPAISAGFVQAGTNFVPISYWAGVEVRGEAGGSIRNLPGYHPSKNTFGVIRKLVPSTNNTRVEVHRRSTSQTEEAAEWELPQAYRRYVRFYALWKCYEQDGPGQDVEFAQHFRQRWEDSLARVKGRISASVKAKTIRLGGPNPTGYAGLPRPQLPANFARRFPRRR